MSKLTYTERVKEFQEKNPNTTLNECRAFVKAQIEEEKNQSKTDLNIIQCIRCGYEIPEPGIAFVCAACGIQN